MNALLPVEIVAPATVTLVDVTFGIERDVVVVVDDDPPEDDGLNTPEQSFPVKKFSYSYLLELE